jgi:hypothetical protein
MYATPGFAVVPLAPAEGSCQQLFRSSIAVRAAAHEQRVLPRLPAPEPESTLHVAGDCRDTCTVDLNCIAQDQYVCPHDEEATIHYCTAKRCRLQRRVGMTNVFRCFLTRKEFTRHPRRISHSVNLRLQRQQLKVKTARKADKKDIIELRVDAAAQQAHQHADAHWDRVAKLYTIIRTVFICCGLPSSDYGTPDQIDKVYHELASICSNAWRCVWDARPSDDADEKTQATFYDNYNHSYHCLVALYNMRTPKGLTIPINSTPGAKRVQVIPPHPFVQRYLPEEKQLKTRAQVLQTKATSMSSNARSAASAAGGKAPAETQSGSMFAIDNKRFTAAREIIHTYLAKWVRHEWNP